MKRPGYLAKYRTLGQGPIEDYMKAAATAAPSSVTSVGNQEMTISGSLQVSRTGSNITALAIYVSPGLGSTGPVGRTYQIRNWESFPKLIAEAQGCQDLPPEKYCSLTIKAKESILSGGEEYIYAVGNNTIPIEITQIIELRKSSSTGRSPPPLKTCRPGSEDNQPNPDYLACRKAHEKDADLGITYIMDPCFSYTIPAKKGGSSGAAAPPSTKPPVKKEKDYSKHLIIGGIVLSILMSALALKI